MSVSSDQMNHEELVKKEVSSCLTDVVVAISETAKDWDRFKRRSYNPPDAQRTSMLPDWEDYRGTLVRSSEVLSYHYDKCVKEKKIEEEEAIYRAEGPVMSGQCCENCGENHIDVLNRGEGGVDSLSVHAPFISTENMLYGRRPLECRASIMCQSCIQGDEDPEIVEDGYAERCSACGISNILCCDEDIIEDHFIYHNYRDLGLCGFCRSCDESLFPGEKEELLYDRRERLTIPYHNTFVVSGLSPRPFGGEYPDSEDDLDLTDDEGLTGDTQEWEEEYENEDLPENNSEKAKEIKDAVMKAGEKVFDLKDDLREGDYLELMDLLQGITNRVNTL